MKYVVANDPNYDISTFGLDTCAQIVALNPNNVSTFNGDFTPFKAKGGKIISYHGRADPVRCFRFELNACADGFFPS